MYFVVMEDRYIELYFKPFVPITLALFYYVSVKKINITYFFIFPLILIGHLLTSYIESYFIYCLLIYTVVNILNLVNIYKNHLAKKSFFNIFTFSLPFFMAFATIFVLIADKMEGYLLVPVFVFIITACINGSIVLLNYSQKQDIDNYLIFIGAFTVISCYACVALYMFGGKDDLYYQLVVLFDYLGEYAICKGIILSQQPKRSKFELT